MASPSRTEGRAGCTHIEYGNFFPVFAGERKIQDLPGPVYIAGDNLFSILLSKLEGRRTMPYFINLLGKSSKFIFIKAKAWNSNIASNNFEILPAGSYTKVFISDFL
jgi:hypothetical protein